MSPIVHSPHTNGGLTLLCFPHAGGSEVSYTHWVGALPGVTVVPVELAGRGRRVQENPLDSMADIVSDLAGTLLPYLSGQFALFGHSMGGLIAFELARKLRRQFGLLPARVLVSGCASPESDQVPDPPRHSLPDDELWVEVGKLNGTPEVVKANSKVRRLYTAAIRADFTVVETYTPAGDSPLDCPISVFGGRDDPEVAVSELDGWAAHTTADYHVTVFPGDHFFLHNNRRAFLDGMDRELARSLTSSGRE